MVFIKKKTFFLLSKREKKETKDVAVMIGIFVEKNCFPKLDFLLIKNNEEKASEDIVILGIIVGKICRFYYIISISDQTIHLGNFVSACKTCQIYNLFFCTKS